MAENESEFMNIPSAKIENLEMFSVNDLELKLSDEYENLNVNIDVTSSFEKLNQNNNK